MRALLARHARRMRADAQSKRSGVPDATRVHFITFTNTDYMPPTRIVAEANAFGFDTVRALNEHDIPEFIETHRSFIEQYRHGYGLWIWKPKIILDALLSMKDDGVLVYCDAGMHLNAMGIPRYHEYLAMMKQPETSAVLFSTNGSYIAQEYVKMDAVQAYNPAFAEARTHVCYAGVMMLRRSPASIALITDWLALCETYHFLDGSVSVAPELSIFKGNDCDNGLFNLCVHKHPIARIIYPDETNVYDAHGNQNHMYTTDWSQLDAFPFQCRRLRPR